MDSILTNTAATLSHTFYGDETATAADGAVTVTVTNAIGVALLTAAATTTPSTGVYRRALVAVTAPDRLTIAWTGTFSGGVVTQTDYLEVVGGNYFALAELRTLESQVQSTTDYPTARLAAARVRAETRLEECLGRAFVSRVAVERFAVSGGCHLRLRHPHVTSVRQVTIDGTVADASSYDLQGNEWTPKLYRSSGWGNWTDTDAVVEVVYVHGLTVVPEDVKWAAMKLSAAYAQKSSLPGGSIVERAIGRFEDPGGGSFGISTAGPGRVGIPEVDAIIADRKLVRFG